MSEKRPWNGWWRRSKHHLHHRVEFDSRTHIVTLACNGHSFGGVEGRDVLDYRATPEWRDRCFRCASPEWRGDPGGH
jgi:hypothetical protein